MINKSKAYLSPLVFSTMEDFPFQAVKNTYIFSDFCDLEPQLYVLADKHLTNLELISKYPHVLDVFSVEENYLFVTKIDMKFNFEYLCFKRGSYSLYTAEAKNIIVRYLIDNTHRRSLGVVDKIRSVFARDPMLKEYYENRFGVKLDENAELGTKMDEEQETFKSAEHGEFKPIKREINHISGSG